MAVARHMVARFKHFDAVASFGQLAGHDGARESSADDGDTQRHDVILRVQRFVARQQRRNVSVVGASVQPRRTSAFEVAHLNAIAIRIRHCVARVDAQIERAKRHFGRVD